MNYRKQIEEKILFILLTYDAELVADGRTLNSFDIIRKHAVIWSDFESKMHQDIFKAIQNQMHDKLIKLDVLRLVEYRPQEYKVFEQQANQYLQMIVTIKSSAYAAFSELEPLLYKLKEFVMAGFLQNKSQHIMSTNLMNVDVIKYGQTLIEEVQNLYARLTGGLIQIEDNTDDMVTTLSKRRDKFQQGIIGGIQLPVRTMQELMNGINEPDFWVIGARPSMGKSNTGLAIAAYAAEGGHDTMYVSIEMSKLQLTNIIVAKNTGIPIDDIKVGRLSNEQFIAVAQEYKKINNSKLNIVSSQYRWLEKFIDKARSLHKIGKLKLIIVDYLQLMKTEQKSGNRDQMLGIITGELKALCLELNIPIIALSQLKRSSAGHEPVLEDLRESGNIEQDADIVGFIHRPAFYQKNYDQLSYYEQFLTDFIVKKHRGGELGRAKYFQDVKKSMVYDIS